MVAKTTSKSRMSIPMSGSGSSLVSSSKSKPSKPRPPWLMPTVGGVLLVIIGLIVWRILPHRPSPSASAPDLVKFASSDDFALMSAKQKQPYLDALEKIPRRDLFAAADTAKLTDEQRADGMENVMSARFAARLAEFYALDPGKDRDAYLDKMIDEQQKRRAEWMNRPRPTSQPSTQPTAGGPGGGWMGRGQGQAGGANGNTNANANANGMRQRAMDPNRQKRRNELTPPAQRAQMSEFFAAMRARRAARGLSGGGGRFGR